MGQEPGTDTPGTPDIRASQIALSQSACYRIDDLVIEVGRARVTRGDAELALPKLSFDLLLALVEAAPNLVSIDDLMERVWPGLVVSPETVSQRVKLLRTTLDDDPKQPRYIRGVRGRGYRLVAEVSRIDPSAGSMLTSAGASAGVAAISAAPDHRPASRWMMPAAVLGVLLAVAGGIVLWRAASDAPSTSQQADTPVEQAPIRSVAVLPFENLSTMPDGNVVALGLAETVLHQLANLPQLVVIARTSSFSDQNRNRDAREIGRKLNARYLLEGSVQSDQYRLRVTAQLVDAANGQHVWSMQFDRTPQDLFAVQDEIAIDVARALMLSIDTKASQKLANRGTNHVEAWLAYLQGRALLGTRRLADLERAKERLTEAIRLDPSFASGYVALAEAHLLEEYFRYPEFWFLKGALMSPEGRAEIEQLLARALSLDESNGEAYLVRAWLQQDYLQAEADYRRGLALSPNNASGYERFAKLLFFFPGQGGITPDGTPDPAKRSEAFAMIDRARALDPLVPGGHLTKAIMTLWGRGDDEATNALLLQSLEQDPNYYPALVHLAEFLWCCQGEYAEAIRYGEQALALEPGASWPQRSLVHFYLDVGEPETARQILEESKEPNRFGWIPLYLYERDWQKAGEVAFTPGIGIWGLDMYSTIRAISQYFHATGDSKLARGPLEFVSRVQWDVQGAPTLGDDMIPDQSATIALAAILLSTGDRAHARRLLQEVVREAGRQERVYGVSNKFYGMPNPQALALLGEREATIKVLQRTLDNGYLNDWWYQLERDPAYDGMRDDPRFKAILAKMKRHAADQHERLSAMRAAGLVPTRGSTRNPRPSQP